MENWRDVVGYEGWYQVSDQGRVRSLDRVVGHNLGGPKRIKGKLLKQHPKKYGHMSISLLQRGKRKQVNVHRLVAETFLGLCPKGKQVCHGPKGTSDNCVFNLSYGTPSDNQFDKRRDGTHRGKPVIRSDGEVFINMTVAAESINCSQSNIYSACTGRNKTAGGYSWKYAEAT